MSVVNIADQRAAIEWLIREVEGPFKILEAEGHLDGGEEMLRRARAALKTLEFVAANEALIRRAVSSQ